jgi:adenine nucleotide transporter 17
VSSFENPARAQANQDETLTLSSCACSHQYAAFEKLKALLLAFRRRQQLARGPMAAGAGAVVGLSSAELFALGALAKLFATGLSYPLVLLKSRLVRPLPLSSMALPPTQADARASPNKCSLPAQQSASHAYPSIPAALRSIVASEGLLGLYAGLRAKLLQSVLTAALLFAGQQRVYELAKGALGRR